MSKEMIFSQANTIAMIGWLFLILLPRWKWTTRLITAIIIPGLLAIVYCYIIFVHWGSAEGGFGTLAAAMQLFQNPHIALAGWLHYLAFDLFVGNWEVRDAQQTGISHWLVIPSLILTFLFGPIGFGLYLMTRATLKQAVTISED